MSQIDRRQTLAWLAASALPSAVLPMKAGMAVPPSATDGGRVESTASATFAPTPWTLCRRLNHSRSSALMKPKSFSWSSRT